MLTPVEKQALDLIVTQQRFANQAPNRQNVPRNVVIDIVDQYIQLRTLLLGDYDDSYAPLGANIQQGQAGRLERYGIFGGLRQNVIDVHWVWTYAAGRGRPAIGFEFAQTLQLSADIFFYWTANGIANGFRMDLFMGNGGALVANLPVGWRQLRGGNTDIWAQSPTIPTGIIQLPAVLLNGLSQWKTAWSIPSLFP